MDKGETLWGTIENRMSDSNQGWGCLVEIKGLKKVRESCESCGVKCVT